jgi:hypothetical protein
MTVNDEDEKNGGDRDGDEEDITRINFTIPKKMKEQWQDVAKSMTTSISQLIRNAVQAYTKDIEDELEKMNGEIEDAGKGLGTALRILNAPQDHAVRTGTEHREPYKAHTDADPLDQLKKLKELLDIGAITEAEFDQKKAKLLSMI